MEAHSLMNIGWIQIYYHGVHCRTRNYGY